MSETIMRAGLDASGYVAGARTVTKANLDMEQSSIKANSAMNALEGRFGGIGNSSKTGFGAAKAALSELEHPIKDFGNWLDMIRDRILRIGATVVVFAAIGTAIGGLIDFFKGAIKAVDDFQVATIQIAAGLTQIASSRGVKDMATAYYESSRYAGALAIKLQEVDKNSLANYQGLQAMLQVMTAQGVVLDINKKKQVDAFTDISNAIALYTAGQDQQRQMYQETRSLMTGQVNMNSQLARIIDQQIKQQGLYKGGLKEVVALGKQHGDILERIAPYLVGINQASGDIQKTWTAITTSFQTSLGIVQRTAFTPIVNDLVKIVGGFNTSLRSNAEVISGVISKAWERVRDAIFVVDETTKGMSINPEFLATLKSLGSGFVGLFNVVTKTTAFMVDHSEAIKNAVIAYIALRLSAMTGTAVMRMHAMAQAEDIAATISRTQAMILLGVTESNLQTIESRSIALAAERALADGGRVTSALARAEASALIVAASEAEMASNSANALEAIRVTAIDLDSAAAKKVKSLATLEVAKNEVATVAAMMEYEVACNLNTYSDADAAAVKNVLIGSQFKHLAAIEAEIVAQNALKLAVLSSVEVQATNILTDNAAVVAAQRHNAALISVGATTGFVSAAMLRQQQIAWLSMADKEKDIILCSAWDAAHAKNIAMINAKAAALDAQCWSARANMAMTGMLTNAMSLLGGVAGLVTLALLAGVYAWSKWGSAAEEAKKKAAISNKELADFNKRLDAEYDQDQAKRALAAKIDAQAKAEREGGPKIEITADDKYVVALGDKWEWYKEKVVAVGEKVKDVNDWQGQFDKAVSSGAYKKNQSYYDGLSEQIRKTRGEISDTSTLLSDAKAKALREFDNRPKAPEQGKGLPDDGKTKIAREMDLHKEWLAYLRNTSAYEIAIEKENAQSRQITIDERYRQAQISQATHLQLMHESRMAALKTNAKALEEFQLQSGTELNKYATEKGFGVQGSLGENAYDQKTGMPNQAGIDAYVGTFGGSDKDKKAYNERTKNVKELLALIKVWDNANLARILNEKNGEQEIAKNLIEKQKIKEAEIKIIEDGNVAYLKSMGLESQAFEASIKTSEFKRTVTDVNAKRLTDAEDMLGLSYMLTESEKLQAEEALTNAKKIIDVQKDKEAVLRRQVVLQDIQRKYDVEKIARDTLQAASAFGASNVGKSLKTGVVGDVFANEMAVETDRHKSMMDSLDAELAKKEEIHTASMNAGVFELSALNEVLAVKQKITEESQKGITNKGAIELKAQIESIKGLETQARTIYPKLTSIAAVSYAAQNAAAGKYTTDTKIGVGNMTKGTANMIVDFGNIGAAVFNDLAASTDQSSRKGFESAKLYSLAGAVMSTAAAVMSQLASMPGPAGWVAAAAAAAIGVVQIAKIAGTTYGGGGSVANVSAGSFTGESAGSGGTVGGSIGAPITSLKDSQSQEQLRNIADNMENASIALMKVSDGLTKVADLFKAGSATALAGGSLATASIADSSGGILKNFVTLMKEQGKSFFTGGAATMISDLQSLMKGDFRSIAVNAILPGLGSLSASIFGGAKSLMDKGIVLGLEQGQVTAQNYATIKTSGGWFGKDSYSMQTSVNTPAQESFQAALNKITGTINTAVVAMGTSVDLKSVNLDKTGITTAGKTPEEINKALQKWLESAANAISKNVKGLQDYAYYGENAFDAIVRLVTALQSANDGFAMIGVTLLSATLAGADTAYRIQDMMGGMDAFVKKVDDYVTNMFTTVQQEAMKGAKASREVAVAFNYMNIEVPKTKAEFISLVSSLDLTTTRGAQLFAGLMDVSTSFALMIDNATKAADALRVFDTDLTVREMKLNGVSSTLFELRIKQEDEMKKAILDGMDTTKLQIIQNREWSEAVATATGAVSTSITSLIDKAKVAATNMVDAMITIANKVKSIMTGPQANLSPTAAYNQAKGIFEGLKGKTDLVSMQALPGAADVLLAASKTYNASGAAYQEDLNAVLDTLRTASGIKGDTVADVDKQLVELIAIKNELASGALVTALGSTGTLAGLLGAFNTEMARKLQADKEEVAKQTLIKLQPKIDAVSAAKNAAMYGSVTAQNNYKSAAAALKANETERVNLIRQINIDEPIALAKLSAFNTLGGYGASIRQKSEQSWVDAKAAYETAAAKVTADNAAYKLNASENTRLQGLVYDATSALVASQNEAVAALPGLTASMNDLASVLQGIISSYIIPVGGSVGSGAPTTVPTATNPITGLDTPLRTGAFWQGIGYESKLQAMSAFGFTTEAQYLARASMFGYSYATGTDRVPFDMTARIHQDEIIMDKNSANVLRKYGIPTSSADNYETVEELRALRKLVSELIEEQKRATRVAQAVGTEVIAVGNKQAKTSESLANTSRLVATQ